MTAISMATSMLENMKDQVSELRIYLMPSNYVINESEIDGMKHGNWPGWQERCVEWYAIPVANREYDATIRIPAGSYKLFFAAVGGRDYTPALFFSASDEVFTIHDGETLSPEIAMMPLGYPIKIEIGNADLNLNNIDGKIQYLLNEYIWIEDVNISSEWNTGKYNVNLYMPYEAIGIKLIVNTNDQILTAPINWDGVIDGKITINLQPQMSGAILSPIFTWPEE